MVVVERNNQMRQDPQLHDGEGSAALGICESLLLALTDLEIMTKENARDLLMDVATTHQEAAALSPTPEKHQAVVAIIQRILAGRNSLPH
jgi:hypothetical protein